MAAPTYETILYDIEDRILTITLNRPDRLNAYNREMMDELIDAMDHADADDEVRAIIFTGAGRGFCAGADLEKGAETFDREARDDFEGIGDSNDLSNEAIRDGGGLWTLRLFESVKPLIAACNGPAVGVGVTMQLPMDIRLGADNARYGFVFSRRGIVPEACSSWFLPRLVGISKALEWTYSGKVFPAQEALEGGLVHSLYKPEDLLPAARAKAKEFIEETSAVSVALTRQMMWRMLGADHPMEAHKIDSRAIYCLGAMADAKEGVTSFLEKRPAEFKLSPAKDMPSYYPWWDERKYE